MLADALVDAWTRAADQGPHTALIAAGWLAARALRFRDINPAVSGFLNRLAELSAGAWLDEIAVQTLDVPDFLPDDFERGDHAQPDEQSTTAVERSELAAEPARPARPPRQQTDREMDVRQHRQADEHAAEGDNEVSLLARRHANDDTPLPEIEPSRDIAQRQAKLRADDLRSYQDSGGDLGIWPEGWNDETSDWFIDPRDRPYYQRDRADDVQLVNSLMDRVREESRRKPVSRVTVEEAKRQTHLAAIRRAQQLRARAEHEAHEARLDQTDRRCGVCDTIGDHTVKVRNVGAMRTIPGYVLGPRICDACLPVVERALREQLERRADVLAEQSTPNGRRLDAARAWVADNERKLLP